MINAISCNIHGVYFDCSCSYSSSLKTRVVLTTAVVVLFLVIKIDLFIVTWTGI